MPLPPHVPFADLRGPSGHICRVFPGGILGRLVTADFQVSDPKISEAHALLSLRDGVLKLLALRGQISLGAGAVAEIVLAVGQQIFLTDTLSLRVERVELPPWTLVLFGVNDQPQDLSAPISSIIADPREPARLRLRASFVKGALAYIWHNGETLCIQIGARGPEELDPGARFQLNGSELYVTCVPRTGAPNSTSGPFQEPRNAALRIVARLYTVHIHRLNCEPCVLSGKGAQIISELVLFGGKPTPWEVVAREVWGNLERESLRPAWDQARLRLRRHLRSAGIRDSLVRADGAGQIELVILPGDTVVNEVE